MKSVSKLRQLKIAGDSEATKRAEAIDRAQKIVDLISKADRIKDSGIRHKALLYISRSLGVPGIANE